MQGRSGRKKLALRSEKVGPGAYDLPEIISKPRSRVVFPKSKRFRSKKKLDNVGPGSYYPKMAKSGIGYSMRTKTKWADLKCANPGPGTYFPKVDLLFKKCRLPVFGKNKRGKENRSQSKIVGPGSYFPKLNKSHLGYSFGKDSKFEDFSKLRNFPGPGHYDIKSFLESYPAYATWNMK